MFHFFQSFLLAIFLPILSLGSVQVEEPQPVVILGGGVGSLTSALYLGRAGLHPLVIEGPVPGGLLTQSYTVQNWPGEMEIKGAALTDKMKEQAQANGAHFLNEEVIQVDFSTRPFAITTRTLDGSGKEHQIYAASCIIAMGTKPNFLGIPGESEYWGKGVTNCAICDGSLYKDKVVGVVGGGDAAVLEALYLSNIAREVYVFVRTDKLTGVEGTRVRALLDKPNVHLQYHAVVEEVKGDGESVVGVRLKVGGRSQEVKLDGFFLAICSTPHNQMFQKALTLDQKGYIVLTSDQETSVKGVYAIGDIVDPVYKQAVSAAGDGAKAALQVQQYLSDRQNKLVVQKTSHRETKKVHISKEVIEIHSTSQFHNELASSGVPVVVDFYATWCGPCKKVSPLLDHSAVRLAGKVKFLKVNVDKLSDLSSSYNVKSMPTVVLFDAQGAELERKVGLEQITELLKKLQPE